MSSFGIWHFSWFVIGCVIGFGAGVVFLFLLGFLLSSSPGTHDDWIPLFLPVIRSAWSSVAILAAVWMCYALNLDKVAASLVLVVVVLLVAKLAGSVHGIIASVVTVGLFAFLFLPPIGSVRVSDAEDRLALVLLLVTAAAGSQLVGGKKGLPG